MIYRNLCKASLVVALTCMSVHAKAPIDQKRIDNKTLSGISDEIVKAYERKIYRATAVKKEQKTPLEQQVKLGHDNAQAAHPDTLKRHLSS